MLPSIISEFMLHESYRTKMNKTSILRGFWQWCEAQTIRPLKVGD